MRVASALDVRKNLFSIRLWVCCRIHGISLGFAKKKKETGSCRDTASIVQRDLFRRDSYIGARMNVERALMESS